MTMIFTELSPLCMLLKCTIVVAPIKLESYTLSESNRKDSETKASLQLGPTYPTTSGSCLSNKMPLLCVHVLCAMCTWKSIHNMAPRSILTNCHSFSRRLDYFVRFNPPALVRRSIRHQKLQKIYHLSQWGTAPVGHAYGSSQHRRAQSAMIYNEFTRRIGTDMLAGDRLLAN